MSGSPELLTQELAKYEEMATDDDLPAWERREAMKQIIELKKHQMTRDAEMAKLKQVQAEVEKLVATDPDVLMRQAKITSREKTWGTAIRAMRQIVHVSIMPVTIMVCVFFAVIGLVLVTTGNTWVEGFWDYWQRR